MHLSDFDYHLPENLIAQRPCEPRDAARLLVLDRRTGAIRHDIFRNISQYLPPESLLVLNNSKVVPARLLGEKLRSGGAVEVFLLKHVQGRRYEAMLRPLKKIRDQEPLCFAGGLTARLVDRAERLVEFDQDNVLELLQRAGHIPLPPYIRRSDDEADRIDYQTVYAKRAGSVAAPTAGLHFTKSLLAEIKRAGHGLAEVTLHVNYGTFKPVEAEDVVSHPMHSEEYFINPSTLRAVGAAQEAGAGIIAVGTTSCRVLEAYAQSREAHGSTKLFLYPGARFHMISGLITNFHLPKSTLFMLVCAFGGVDFVQKAYLEAIRERYRFYSYGDAMLVL